MLNLIYGTSGAGKTGALIQRIRQDIENKQKCFLLVPEQQAYISERDLPAALPQNAGLYFEVVNFSSLAEDVFCEYGGITQGTLSNSMRNLLMWDTLRSLAPLLKRYGKGAASDTSMTHLMLQAVNELRMNNIDSKKIEESVNQIDADTALREKLSDIALIEAVFHDRNESVFGTDPSDKLLRMATVLDAHTYFQNTNRPMDKENKLGTVTNVIVIKTSNEKVKESKAIISFNNQVVRYLTTEEVDALSEEDYKQLDFVSKWDVEGSIPVIKSVEGLHGKTQIS